MTYYADLSRFTGFHHSDVALTAVGWLDATAGFRKGTVSRAFFDALARLLEAPWQPFVAAGRHSCELCVFSGGPSHVHVGSMTIAVGANNVFVPGQDRAFIAPSLVLHYVDAHEYSPPNEFQDAVLACPEMRSMAYLRAIHKLGLQRLAIPPDHALGGRRA